tara:strand:+ start:348 stop:644 length:297 start_codon:yes stop_codon:yes gene_type:complete
MKAEKFVWINIFVRDIFIAAAIMGINYLLNFKSFFAAMLIGMQMVLVTWHLHDFIKLNRRLNNGSIGLDSNNSSSVRDIRNILQQNKETEYERNFRGD